jgi:hypothetical protein
MELVRDILQVAALGILVAGPACILGVSWFRMASPPTFAKFIVMAVAICSVAFWIAFLLAEAILELQFHAIAPDGSWTPTDEAGWTDSERRVVATYFGDGGRNVFALFVAIPLVLYSTALWVITRGFQLAMRRLTNSRSGR